MSFAPWIKIETTTPDKPEVIAMATCLKEKDPDLIVGKLVRLWGWADANSVDGCEMTITRAWIDRYTGMKGFARALEEVGWLSGPDGAIEFANFERHNGESAKRRAMETRKKQRQRGEGQMSRSHRDKTGDQEEEIDRLERESVRVRELIKTLRPGRWDLPGPFSATEEALLRQNLPSLAAWLPATWDALRRYLAAKIADGAGVWQPIQLRKFLESHTEAARQAQAWDLKQQNRKPPAAPPPEPEDPAEQLSAEEASRILRGDDKAA